MSLEPMIQSAPVPGQGAAGSPPDERGLVSLADAVVGVVERLGDTPAVVRVTVKRSESRPDLPQVVVIVTDAEQVYRFAARQATRAPDEWTPGGVYWSGLVDLKDGPAWAGALHGVRLLLLTEPPREEP